MSFYLDKFLFKVVHICVFKPTGIQQHRKIIKDIYIFTIIYVFIFWSHPRHVEVPKLGIEPAP